ncbi:hypothetical protein [Noviherbaspirillum sp. Root189]|uniref:hypothetical protein n=1 Tax=Noviherbaspirillum sp. Root189 TaxID=1736487 RepID=UPI0012E3A80E|nr:hypothetical protein [Noviherbaspirillum sp. Root189]
MNRIHGSLFRVTTRVSGQIPKPNSMEIQGIGKVLRATDQHTVSINRSNEDDKH